MNKLALLRARTHTHTHTGIRRNVRPLPTHERPRTCIRTQIIIYTVANAGRRAHRLADRHTQNGFQHRHSLQQEHYYLPASDTVSVRFVSGVRSHSGVHVGLRVHALIRFRLCISARARACLCMCVRQRVRMCVFVCVHGPAAANAYTRT